MKHIDVTAIRSQPEKRFEFLAEFVGFREDDWDAIEESLAVLGPRLPAILDALYDHLLSYDDTRRIFLGAHGEIDPAYMAIRKEHLSEWVLQTAAGRQGKRAAFASYLMDVGRRHTGIDGEPGRTVPPRYIVALTSFVQTALLVTLFEALPGETARVRRLGLAWNKMMVIQLEMFLKALVPQWPGWDEGAADA